jgi:hypothetical protein
MKTITNQSYDAYESLARERQNRNLKISKDARMLNSLSDRGSQTRSNKGSGGKSRRRLSSLPASLFLVIKCQPA